MNALTYRILRYKSPWSRYAARCVIYEALPDGTLCELAAGFCTRLAYIDAGTDGRTVRKRLIAWAKREIRRQTDSGRWEHLGPRGKPIPCTHNAAEFDPTCAMCENGSEPGHEH